METHSTMCDCASISPPRPGIPQKWPIYENKRIFWWGNGIANEVPNPPLSGGREHATSACGEKDKEQRRRLIRLRWGRDEEMETHSTMCDCASISPPRPMFPQKWPIYENKRIFWWGSGIANEVPNPPGPETCVGETPPKTCAPSRLLGASRPRPEG